MNKVFSYIRSQLSNPTGLVGVFSTTVMNIVNNNLYNHILNFIDARKSDVILEIGFGNGLVINKLIKKNARKIYGVDISPDMIRIGTYNNRGVIKNGKVELLLGTVNDLPFNNNFFDKIYTINTIYFWENLDNCFSEISRVLKPNGVFMNIFYTKNRFNDPVSSNLHLMQYEIDGLIQLMEKNRLSLYKIESLTRKHAVCIIGQKRE